LKTTEYVPNRKVLKTLLLVVFAK